jgi:hypothetical protein
MNRTDSRTYKGQPGETVDVTTTVSGGGQVAVTVDGVVKGPQAQFRLPPNPGDRITWEIALIGPLGADCVVTITVVDGGADGDFLVCQAHNPAPVHFYSASVVAVPASVAAGATRGRGPGVTKVLEAAPSPKPAAKKAPAKAARKAVRPPARKAVKKAAKKVATSTAKKPVKKVVKKPVKSAAKAVRKAASTRRGRKGGRS